MLLHLGITNYGFCILHALIEEGVELRQTFLLHALLFPEVGLRNLFILVYHMVKFSTITDFYLNANNVKAAAVFS